jgi:hypothetical protein
VATARDSRIAAMSQELARLLKTKAMEPTPAAEFPALTEVLAAPDGEAIRPRLKEVLNQREADEKEFFDGLGDPATEADKPFAEPMRILLGLTPRSEHKGIGARRQLAARKRRVSVRTMRRHQVLMAKDLATYLLTRQAEPAFEIPKWPSYASLCERPVGEWRVILKALSLEELHKLVTECAQSYRTVAATIAASRPHGPAPHWRNFFLALQQLGERGFQDQRQELPPRLKHSGRAASDLGLGFGLKLFRSLDTEVWIRKNTPTRYAVVMKLLHLISARLLPFNEKHRKELEDVADMSGGQQAVFLAMLGNEDVDAPVTIPSGPRIFADWCALTAVRVDTTDLGLSPYQAIDLGFNFIWQLLYPDPKNRINMKAVNQYVVWEGGTDPASAWRDRIANDKMIARGLKLLPRPIRDYPLGPNLLKEEIEAYSD